jgi:hypothetical protein
VTLTADDTSDIDATVAAVSLAAAFGVVGVAISIGVSLAENTITNQVEAYIINADNVTARNGSIILGAVEDASISADSVAASLSVSIGLGGNAFSGAGANAFNTIENHVKAYIDNSTVTTGVYDYTTEDNTTQLNNGDRVFAENGFIYEYVGDDRLEATPIVLSAEDYADSTKWNLVNPDVAGTVDHSVVDTPVQLNNGERVRLNDGHIYEYTGDARSDSAGIDLSAEDYSDSTQWELVDTDIDIIVNAQNTSEITSLVGATSAAVSGGKEAVAGAVGVSIAKNIIMNQVEAYIKGSTVSSADDIIVSAISTETVDAVAFSGSVAIAIGIGGAGAGCGVELTNSFTTKVHAYMQDTDADASGDIDITAVSDAEVKKADAIGVSIAASLGAASVAASLSDNTIKNDVQAYIKGNDHTVEAGGDISVSADVAKAKISEVHAVTASVSGGAVGLSGGGTQMEMLMSLPVKTPKLKLMPLRSRSV